MIKLPFASSLISLGRVPNFSVTVVNDMFHKNSESNVNCSKTVAIGVSGGRQTTHHTPTGFIPDCHLDATTDKSSYSKNSVKHETRDLQRWLLLLKFELDLRQHHLPSVLKQLPLNQLLPILEQLLPLVRQVRSQQTTMTPSSRMDVIAL